MWWTSDAEAAVTVQLATKPTSVARRRVARKTSVEVPTTLTMNMSVCPAKHGLRLVILNAAVNGGCYHGVITAISRDNSTECGSDKPVWSRRSRGKFGVLCLAPFRVLTELELSIPPRLAAASLLWLFGLPSSPCRSLPSIPPTFSHHGCKPLESPRYVNVNWRRCRLY